MVSFISPYAINHLLNQFFYTVSLLNLFSLENLLNTGPVMQIDPEPLIKNGYRYLVLKISSG